MRSATTVGINPREQSDEPLPKPVALSKIQNIPLLSSVATVSCLLTRPLQFCEQKTVTWGREGGSTGRLASPVPPLRTAPTQGVGDRLAAPAHASHLQPTGAGSSRSAGLPLAAAGGRRLQRRLCNMAVPVRPVAILPPWALGRWAAAVNPGGRRGEGRGAQRQARKRVAATGAPHTAQPGYKSRHCVTGEARRGRSCISGALSACRSDGPACHGGGGAIGCPGDQGRAGVSGLS